MEIFDLLRPSIRTLMDLNNCKNNTKQKSVHIRTSQTHDISPTPQPPTPKPKCLYRREMF